ncbi:MAG: TIGR01906 family membrane protein [Dehalococcoidia bacterium]|nr:MAG: TIGR01906 family membrane protein [Dehalococcoidia bacterium]
MLMKNIKWVFINISRWLFILCIPTVLLTTSICIAVNSQWLYEYGFDKYDVAKTTNLADIELGKAARGLINYFNSNEDIIDIIVFKDNQPFTLFNQKEVAHLKDVKGLIWVDYWVLVGTSTFALVYIVVVLYLRLDEYRRQLASALIKGSGLTVIFMLLLGLVVLLDFDSFFLQFHLISFTNELWQLDPTKDYLIMLFPQGFWYDATLFCALLTVGLAFLITGLVIVYLFFEKRREIF